MNRRDFLGNGLAFGVSALASGCLATRMVGPDEDWKTVFRMMGFDPEAKGATHAAFLGRLAHHRKTGEVEKVWLSTDNANWTSCPDALPTEDVYAYEIPESMRSSDWIYLRVDGFKHGNDSCIAGYALMKV